MSICIIDNKGTVCIWGNPEKLYGIKKSEIIGKKLGNFPYGFIIRCAKKQKNQWKTSSTA